MVKLGLGLRIIKCKDKRVLHVSWGYKGDSLMYVTAGKTKGAFISGMKGVTTIEGHDCKQLCFITKETTLYGFLTVCFVSCQLLLLIRLFPRIS